MSTPLPTLIRRIQTLVGVPADGIFGPITAAATLRALDEDGAATGPAATAGDFRFDLRTEKALGTLDPAGFPQVRPFIAHAKAIAAAMGCDWIIISAYRDPEEQQRIYDSGVRPAARPWSSWHNFRAAFDAGIFRGRAYLDESNPSLARSVHAAVGSVADLYDLTWGGSWLGKACDPPHFQPSSLPGAPTSAHRARFEAAGSIF